MSKAEYCQSWSWSCQSCRQTMPTAPGFSILVCAHVAWGEPCVDAGSSPRSDTLVRSGWRSLGAQYAPEEQERNLEQLLADIDSW